jgi:hypothetical protein
VMGATLDGITTKTSLRKTFEQRAKWRGK